MNWRILIQRLDAEEVMAEHQTCKCCLRVQRLEFSVPDQEWALAVPKELRKFALCIECYLRFCEAEGVTTNYKIHD